MIDRWWGCGRIGCVMFNLQISNVVICHLNEYRQVKIKSSQHSYFIYNVIDMKSINGIFINPTNTEDYMPFKFILLQRIHDYDKYNKNDYSIGIIISNQNDYEWFREIEVNINHPDKQPLNVKPTLVNVVSESNLLYHSSLPWKSSEIIPLSEVIQSYEVDFLGAAETNIAKKILQHLW